MLRLDRCRWRSIQFWRENKNIWTEWWYAYITRGLNKRKPFDFCRHGERISSGWCYHGRNKLRSLILRLYGFSLPDRCRSLYYPLLVNLCPDFITLVSIQWVELNSRFVNEFGGITNDFVNDLFDLFLRISNLSLRIYP